MYHVKLHLGICFLTKYRLLRSTYQQVLILTSSIVDQSIPEHSRAE